MRRREDQERGQILVMFAVGLVVFLGFAALTVDLGSLYVARRDYQNAADAAALAGAAYLTRPINDECADIPGSGTSKQVCARTAAWNYLNNHLSLGLSAAQIGINAASNTTAGGETVNPGGGSDYTIWVSTPPNGATTAAAFSTVYDEQSVIFVRIDRNRDVFFGKLFVPEGFEVSAWATAGIFPNRWAVITLRRGRGGTEIDSGPANTTDIKLAGTNSRLNVINGDVGGNWGMKLSADSLITVSSTTGDEAAVYLIDHVSCGNSCWTAGQVQDGSGGAKPPKHLPAFVADPNYPAPPGLTANAPDGPVDNPAPTLDIPRSPNTPTSGPDRDDIAIKNSDPGSVSGAGCSADSPVLGPGWVEDIDIAGGKCLIVRGDVYRTDMFDPATEQDVPLSQMPGVLYVTGQINVGNNALLVADGVTVVMRPDGSNGQFSPNSGGVMDLNRGLSDVGAVQKLGGWTSKGVSTYHVVGGRWVYNGAMESNPSLYGVGIALYVLRSDQVPYALGDGTEVISVNSGAGLAWNGITYAPEDNVAISGQPSHDGIGQLVSWTFTFNGGTEVTQTFDGPGDGVPYLIEPCVMNAGACQ